jgi:predicted anti-sigma-YlaC factor YlaD
MAHLDSLQLVDALEEALPEVEDHLRQCPACRAQLDELRAALDSVRADVPPEPSPLFWNHFASRVNARIDRRDSVPAAAPERGWLPHALAWCGVLALVLAVVSIIVAPTRPIAPPGATAAEQLAASPAETGLEEDEAWSVIRGLAAGLDDDEARAAGVAPRPGAADSIAMELSDTERAELARLIDAELKRIGP